MDIEKKREQEKLIETIHTLQKQRKIVLSSTKIIFSCPWDNHSVFIFDNSNATDFKQSVISELDIQIGLLIDKLKNI